MFDNVVLYRRVARISCEWGGGGGEGGLRVSSEGADF